MYYNLAGMTNVKIKSTDLRIILLSFVIVGILLGLLKAILQLDPEIFSHFFGLDKIFIFLQKQVTINIFFFYAVFMVVPVTLICEVLIPVDSKQKLWSFDVTQDLIWLFISKLSAGTFFVWYAIVLSSFYDKHLSILTIDYFQEMPNYLRFIMGFLLTDFLGWLHHLIRHKAPWFWHFHAIHHSQKRMNLFTDFRVHFGDFLIAKTIMFIPLLMLSFEVPEILIFQLFRMSFTRLYHGNIRSNFGPLKYILVTPQSHRIHHSILEEHRDKNFGVILSIWDRIFNTHLDDGTFPETGINDATFPHPKNNSVKEMLLSLIKQIFYPFKKIYISIF